MKRYLILKNYLDDEMDLRKDQVYLFFKNYHTHESLQKIKYLVERKILHPLDNPPFPTEPFTHEKLKALD